MTLPPRPRLRRAALVLLFAGATAAVVFFEVPFCPMARFAHIPCPGCGLTRATLALLRGDVATALSLHPLAPLVTPLVGISLVANLVSYVRHGTLLTLRGKAARWANVLLLTTAAAMFVLWVARFFGAFGGPVPVETSSVQTAQRGNRSSPAPG